MNYVKQCYRKCHYSEPRTYVVKYPAACGQGCTGERDAGYQ